MPLNQPPVLASVFETGDRPAYAREGNPTWAALEDAIGALDGGSALTFASGMAASAAVLDELEPGARVVAADSAYVELRRLLERRCARGSLALTSVRLADEAALREALTGAAMLWLDSISNPGLEVAPVDRVVRIAREAGAVVAVDATLATPLLQRPLELGADVVVHSAAKAIGGHSDLMLGVAVARDPERAERLRRARELQGAVPGTMDAWLALRGLRTLPLRIERGQQTAAKLAERLAQHPAVASVSYPGLVSHPDHRTATRVLDGFGTTLCFEPSGGRAVAERVCELVEVLICAGSLGGVESLIDRPAGWSASAGVPEGMLRVSVGCEDPVDLVADLESALERAVNDPAGRRARSGGHESRRSALTPRTAHR